MEQACFRVSQAQGRKSVAESGAVKVWFAPVARSTTLALASRLLTSTWMRCLLGGLGSDGSAGLSLTTSTAGPGDMRQGTQSDTTQPGPPRRRLLDFRESRVRAASGVRTGTRGFRGRRRGCVFATNGRWRRRRSSPGTGRDLQKRHTFFILILSELMPGTTHTFRKATLSQADVFFISRLYCGASSLKENSEFRNRFRFVNTGQNHVLVCEYENYNGASCKCE